MLLSRYCSLVELLIAIHYNSIIYTVLYEVKDRKEWQNIRMSSIRNSWKECQWPEKRNRIFPFQMSLTLKWVHELQSLKRYFVSRRDREANIYYLPPISSQYHLSQLYVTSAIGNSVFHILRLIEWCAITILST